MNGWSELIVVVARTTRKKKNTQLLRFAQKSRKSVAKIGFQEASNDRSLHNTLMMITFPKFLLVEHNNIFIVYGFSTSIALSIAKY